jgi:hypothetical protein
MAQRGNPGPLIPDHIKRLGEIARIFNADAADARHLGDAVNFNNENLRKVREFWVFQNYSGPVTRVTLRCA